MLHPSWSGQQSQVKVQLMHENLWGCRQVRLKQIVLCFLTLLLEWQIQLLFCPQWMSVFYSCSKRWDKTLPGMTANWLEHQSPPLLPLTSFPLASSQGQRSSPETALEHVVLASPSPQTTSEPQSYSPGGSRRSQQLAAKSPPPR